MRQLLAIFFATGFTLAVCLAAGKLILQLVRARLTRLEEYFLGFVTGAACVSTIVLGLTAAGQAHRGVFLAVGLVIIALAIRRGAHRFSNAGTQMALPWTWKIIFGILFAVFGVLYLGNALEPETSPDGVAYHVALAARYLRAHHIEKITTNFTANYPEGMEMLFLFAFAFGKHTAAAMVHFLFLLMAPFGMLAYGRRIGSPVAGVIGALLFFMSPIVGKTGSSAYVDVALACAVFAVFLLLEIWREESNNGLLVPIGICAGFAYATKYTGGLVIVYAIGAVLFNLWRTRKPLLLPAVLVAACSLLVAGPWILKNVITVRNPVSPFATEIFPNPYLSVWLEKNWLDVQRVRSNLTANELPLELSVGGSRLYGVVGPAFLLAPLLLLGLRTPPGRRIAFAAILFAIPCLAAPETRLWINSLIFASMGMALVLARWRAIAVTVVLLHALTCWPAVLNRFVHPYAWRIGDVDWKAALRLTPEADFLRRHVTDYNIGLTIDKIVPAGEPIFSFSGIQQAYQSHEVIVDWTSSFGARVSDALRTPFTKTLQPTERHDYRFAQVTARKIRLTQTARSETDRWSITELHVFRQGVELRRAPEWRLRASSNPWDVRLAFDNDAVTRWTSYAAYRPGMFVEVDFGHSQPIDQVAADCSREQPGMNMRLEYQAAAGEWRTIAEGATIYDIPPPSGMRRAAIQQVERDNVHWLLMHDLELDRGTRDFYRYQKLWGIRLVAAEGPFKLYKLE
jgi:Dolichyl-phosphate-mannose-protein mannosyltransferase